MRNLNKKSVNPLLWLIFAIVIPIIIIISLTVLVLAIAGLDVSGWTKDKASKIPIVSSFITTEEEKKIEEIEQEMNELIENRETEIEQLKVENENLKGTVQRLHKEIEESK